MAAATCCVAVAFAGLLAASGSVATPARPRPAPPASLCSGGERVVYSCGFGAKIGSVCLGRSSLHYRFGRLGRPELAVASTPDWRNIRTGGNRSQGGLNQDYIRFTNGLTHYVVHVDETGSLNESPGIRSSGIEVLRGASGERQIASLACKTSARFNREAFDALQTAAPQDWVGTETPGSPFEMVY
ncbi:hypothetical protein GGQ88_001410 [Novosphingobium hassiacum]|uniref:Secreted protein n=1 Tax=Novosphingobium hassiacum TaxID=173676 RepID=A0A7W6EVX1_9SPHN|nr:hypothetical protein [Novosphingobium hassiacum]MBB3860149.1 hypothetical protein [Novosphingobium hassiacum]